MQSDSRFIQFSANDLLRQALSLIKAYLIGHRMHQDRHNQAIGGFQDHNPTVFIQVRVDGDSKDFIGIEDVSVQKLRPPKVSYRL